MPVGSALLLDLAPPERRQSVLAVNYTVVSVAYTLAVSPAGYVAEQGYGLLALLSAAGYFAVAGLYFFGLRGPLPLEPSRSDEGFYRSVAAVFRDRVLVGFAAMAFVFPFSMGLVAFVSPLFGADRGLGEGFIGLVLGLNSVIVALAAVPVATRMEHAGPFRWLGWAALVVAVSLACFAAPADARAALIAGTLIFSFGELVFSSALPAAVARLAPPGRRGAYQGAWTLVGSVGMGSALFVSGLLREATGWSGAWLIYAGVTFAAGVLLLVTRERFTAFQETRQDPRLRAP
jgi:predicted MFS family arabinose efflux permease